MGNIIKRFVIYYIFALFAIGWLIFVIRFLVFKHMNMTDDILYLAVIIAGLWMSTRNGRILSI